MKPTAAMKKAAAQGLELHKSGDFSQDMPSRALEVGKKIASGQKLSDEHINDMAHFHSSHTCNGDCEDLLWGGPAGEVWAKSARARSMGAALADEQPLEKLIGEDAKLSFEVYSDVNLEESFSLGEDDKGFIWAPILRSGMLATRPGPGGEKLDDPLIFVPGHSEDQRKEIGLQDVYDAFRDNAVEYVTLPTTHDNNLLDNTGFVRDLKIVDSQKFPGEKVILAAHEFTEPEIKEKVSRGTIPSRSSGLLYDYKNTTTGKVYPIVLEHTALTHKPWVGGMTPYGQTDEFSERQIIPMLLSERPIKAEEPKQPLPPTKLAEQEKPPEEKSKDGEFLADIQWGDDLSFNNIREQIGSILDRMGGEEGTHPYYWCIDVTNDKALVKINYGLDMDGDAWVVPYSMQDKIVQLSPFSEWIDVEQKWVSDDDSAEDRKELEKLGMSDEGEVVFLGVSQAERDKAKSKGNSLPDGSYPIENKKKLHSAAVLAASKHGDYKAAKSLIRRKAKDLGVDVTTLPGFGGEDKKKKTSKTNTSEDPLKVASNNRLQMSSQPLGGQLMKLLMSEEQMDTLGLSEEAKEIARKQNDLIQEQSIKLAESQKAERATRVTNRIAELKGEGFDQFPGLLVEIEQALLSDDGDIAVKLQLSEQGANAVVPATVTELTERFIKAIPRKDGKVDLGEIGNKTETPIETRPEDKPKDPNEKDEPKTGPELLAQWAKDDPSLADQVIALSSDNGKGQ